MNPDFVPGVDPRTYLKNHRERGPNKYTYTTQDVAALLGVSVKTVRNLTSKSGPNRLDMTDLESICLAWAKRRGYVKKG